MAVQYAVRGNVLERSMELQRRMAAGEKLPFEQVPTKYSEYSLVQYRQ